MGETSVFRHISGWEDVYWKKKPNVPQLYPRYIQWTHNIYGIYTSDIHQICARYTPDISPDIPQIYLRGRVMRNRMISPLGEEADLSNCSQWQICTAKNVFFVGSRFGVDNLSKNLYNLYFSTVFADFFIF